MSEIGSWVLLDEAGLLALNKPPGLPSTGRSLDDPFCLQSMLVRWAGRMVWAVHQLDADTSGAILFVRRKGLVAEAARRLRPPGGRKIYLALCHGEPSFQERTIDRAIGPLRRSGPVRLGIVAGGRPAHTRVRVLARGGGFCVLEVRLLTGRTHQARIHLAHVGHPLIGERLYRAKACDLHPRHALHAARLVLGGAPRRVVDAPVAPDLLELAERLGLAGALLAGSAGSPADARERRGES